MRIALLSAEYPPIPGGVGDYTRRLGQALLARSHQVLVFTIHDSRFTIYDLSSDKNDHKSEIANRKSDWGWRCWRDVIAALEATHPDILHIQYQTGAYAMHPAINLLPWRLRGLPERPRVAVTAHDLLMPYLFPKAGPLRGWVTRRLLADADATVVTNESDMVEARRLGIRDWRLSVNTQSPISNLQSPILIPIGSNIPVAPPLGYRRAAWRTQLGVTPEETLMAYFGLISHSKGLHVLLDALARLPASFRLIVVGGEATQPQDRAYADEVRRQIADRGLSERTIITGHCAEEQVSAHLLAADLAALPFADGASFRRGSLLAALAHGVPVVTTTNDQRPTTNERASVLQRSSLVVQSLQEGQNVLFVSPEDPAGLAAAIERLAGDANLRAQLSAGGRALATQFSWQTIAERHEALYQQLLDRSFEDTCGHSKQ